MDRPFSDYIIGDWQIERAITDRLAGQSGTFTGTATFSGIAPTLRYFEEGTMTLGTATLRAHRSYRWQCQPDGADVFFDDGKPFHSFTVQKTAVTHLCGADTYVGSYAFVGSDRWQVTWQVSGPRKDYTHASTYHREPTALLQSPHAAVHLASNAPAGVHHTSRDER